MHHKIGDTLKLGQDSLDKETKYFKKKEQHIQSEHGLK